MSEPESAWMIWLVIVGLMLLLGVLVGMLLREMSPKGTYISFSGDPNPKCPDCNGTGIINEGDEHFEFDCPCTMRIYDC